MTPTMQKLVELDKKKVEIKAYYEELADTLKKLEAEIGVNGYFQDADGTVYKICKAEGRFVKFEEFEYVRTKKPGEARGTLSVKEAEEHGFSIP